MTERGAKRLPRGEPLSKKQIDYVKEMVSTLGADIAGERLHLSRTAIYRIMAGMPVLAGTRALVEERMRDA